MTAIALNTDADAITAQSGSNLALSFFCLPPEKRRAMSVFYAFCRVVDDIADSTTLSVEEKKRQLQDWREEIHRAYLSRPQTALGQELGEVIRHCLVPPTLMEEIILGVEMDLAIHRYPDFKSLEQYCYRVASAVGLVSIEIFGYRKKQTRAYAVALGMAFQLTNILRDVKKDASFGRVYLPQEEIRHFGAREEDILQGRLTPQLRQLFRFQYLRASHYFAKSWRLLHPVDRPNMVAAEIMREVYHGVLEKIHRRNFDVFNHDVRLNKAGKALRVWKAFRREKKQLPTPPPPKKVLVLGGGFAGLSAAAQLTLRGHEVTVLEARGALGGRAQSFAEPKTGEIIDNGQHVLMGCYQDAFGLIHTLGVSDRLLQPDALDVPYQSERGSSALKAPALPAPLHSLWALLRFKELNWADRWAATRLCARLRLGQRPQTNETVLDWLTRWKQTPGAIRAVWEPLCLAALNEPPRTATASLMATVISRALLGNARDSSIVISTVGLSELFAPETQTLLKMCGGAIERNQVVSRILFEGDRVLGVETQGGRRFDADAIISALPWNALRGLLPEGRLKTQCAALRDSAIVSLHLWFDRAITDRPFTGFLDSPLHWVFNRDAIEKKAEPTHRYALIISGANNLNDKSPSELEALALGELHRLLPLSRAAQVKHRFIYKSPSATFATTPEAERHRPGTRTEWENFFLAGDWTATGLPATIEGAVQSGRVAAQCADEQTLTA
jgi:squalene synthase HpnD